MTGAGWKLFVAWLTGVVPTLVLATGATAYAPHLTVDPDQGPQGTMVVARGTGFCTTCGPVEIDFVARPVKRGIAPAADGSFETTFQVPGGAQAGTNAVNAYQQGGLVTQTSFAVTPSAPAPTDSPPRTGTPGPQTSGGAGATPPPHASPTATTNASNTTPTLTPSAGRDGPAAGQHGSSANPPIAAIALLVAACIVVLAAAGALLYRRRHADSQA